MLWEIIVKEFYAIHKITMFLHIVLFYIAGFTVAILFSITPYTNMYSMSPLTDEIIFYVFAISLFVFPMAFDMWDRKRDKRWNKEMFC